MRFKQASHRPLLVVAMVWQSQPGNNSSVSNEHLDFIRLVDDLPFLTEYSDLMYKLPSHWQAVFCNP